MLKTIEKNYPEKNHGWALNSQYCLKFQGHKGLWESVHCEL